MTYQLGKNVPNPHVHPLHKTHYQPLVSSSSNVNPLLNGINGGVKSSIRGVAIGFLLMNGAGAVVAPNLRGVAQPLSNRASMPSALMNPIPDLKAGSTIDLRERALQGNTDTNVQFDSLLGSLTFEGQSPVQDTLLFDAIEADNTFSLGGDIGVVSGNEILRFAVTPTGHEIVDRVSFAANVKSAVFDDGVLAVSVRISGYSNLFFYTEDNGALTLRSSIEGRANRDLKAATNIVIGGDMAWTSGSTAQGIDISDIDNATLVVSSRNPSVFLDNRGIAISGDRLWTLDFDHLTEFDISNPLALSVVSDREVCGYCLPGDNLKIFDQQIFWRDGSALKYFESIDPSPQAEVTSLMAGESISDYAVYDDTVLLALGDSGLQVWDLNNPNLPVIGFVTNDWRVDQVAIDADSIYITDSQQGIKVISRSLFDSALFSTLSPSQAPSPVPSMALTNEPTKAPTSFPTGRPTVVPTVMPTQVPIQFRTESPTKEPSSMPTRQPTRSPFAVPTNAPVVTQPLPTPSPTFFPTMTTTLLTTPQPTVGSTSTPTRAPVGPLTQGPTGGVSEAPTTVLVPPSDQEETDESGDDKKNWIWPVSVLSTGIAFFFALMARKVFRARRDLNDG